MSEEQLSALLAKLKEDAGLREKLQGAGDLDAAVAMAKEAGFDLSKADLLRHQAKHSLALSDEELEGVAGGGSIFILLCAYDRNTGAYKCHTYPERCPH